MKAFLPFILAGAAGLMLRTALSALAQTTQSSLQPYTMDGRDIYNALVCLLICYYGRVIVECVRERRAQARERHKAQRGTIFRIGYIAGQRSQRRNRSGKREQHPPLITEPVSEADVKQNNNGAA